jgi:hypothetical protein
VTEAERRRANRAKGRCACSRKRAPGRLQCIQCLAWARDFRVRNQGERLYACGICGEKGHNRQTCEQAEAAE